MNCTEARDIVDALPEGNMPDASLSQHLRECELCRHYCSEARLLRTLRALEAPEPSSAFIEQALRNATRQGTTQVKSAWGRVAAIAAALVLMVATIIVMQDRAPANKDMPFAEQPSLAIPDPETVQQSVIQQVRILIYSKEDRDIAELSIDLAENLVLEGYTGQQRLSWNTRLKKGANLLVLPVLVYNDGGQMRVTSTLGDVDRTVIVTVVPKSETGQSGLHQQPDIFPADVPDQRIG